jgi:hypothetical protein
VLIGTASAPVGQTSEKALVLALTHPPSGVAASNDDNRSYEACACACAMKNGNELVINNVESVRPAVLIRLLLKRKKDFENADLFTRRFFDTLSLTMVHPPKERTKLLFYLVVG